MRCFLFTVIFMLPLVLFSQNNISGVVYDAETKASMPGVNVLLNDSIPQQTGVNGEFTFQAGSSRPKLRFSYIGYETYVLNFNEGATFETLKIYLKPSLSELGTIVVSASRYEQKIEEAMVSMEVIKPALLENSASHSMESTMDQVPGVSVMDGSVSIRGGSGFAYGAGSRVLMLVDDLPMLAADAGDIKWTALATENIGQVEIIKGASSALFGSSALNGVINLRTAVPKDSGEGKIIFHHGIYDAPQRKELKWWKNGNQSYSGANFSYRKKFGQLDFCGGGNAFSDEGYRQGEKEQRLRGNANLKYHFKKVKRLSAGVNLNLVRTQGGNFLIWQNDSNGAYIPLGGLDTPTTTLSNYITTRTMYDPFVTYAGAKGAVHKLRMRYFRSNNENDSKQESIADFYYAEYSWNKNLGKGFTLITGLGGAANVVHSALYGDHEGRNYFGFLQLEKKFFDRLSVAIGLRGEYFRVDTAETKSDIYLLPGILKDSVLIGRNAAIKPVPRIAANYRLMKFTHIRASYGEGYRFPTIAEKYIRTNAGAIYIYPNDSVRPETGWSAELGVKQGIKIMKWMGYFDLAGFYTEYKDMMEFSFGRWDTNPAPGTLGIGFKSRNVSDAIIRGIDVSLSGEGKIGAFGLSLMCGYTYMDPRQKNYNAVVDTLYGTANYNVLKYRYKHLFKADVEVEYMRASLGCSFRYNSFMENIDRAFSEFIPGVEHYRLNQEKQDYVIDGRIAYRFTKDMKVSFVVRNLLNREYMGRPADMQAPRSFTMQAAVAF